MDILWRVIYLVVLTALLGGMAAPMAEGCSCERLHPQQHFCQASFVIGGRVMKREYVRTSTDMSVFGPAISEPAPLPEGFIPRPGVGLHGLPDEPFAEGLEPYPEDLDPLPQPKDLDPLPQPAGGLEMDPLPQPAGLEPQPHPEGLEPIPDAERPPELPPLPLPEEIEPEAENTDAATTTSAPELAVVATIEATTMASNSNKTSADATVSPTKAPEETPTEETEKQRPVNPDSMEAWNYKIVYTVKLQHIYRTGAEEEGWKLGEEVQISTPASSAHCGQTDLKTGKNYFMSGRMSGRVNLCDWIQEHHRLTSRQKQGLKHGYGQNCDNCQIVACPSKRSCKKPKSNRSMMCAYDASLVQIGGPYPAHDCLASHSRCTLRGNKCKWQKNNDYHDCSKPDMP